MKKRWLLSAVSLLAAFSFVASCAIHRRPPTGSADGLIGHPTTQLAKHYEDLDYGCMLVVPYFLDIMGIYSLQRDRHVTEVKNFIDWSFARLNKGDRWGLTGTIFDYVICCDGTEISTLQYDSADGYAGQFLMLVREYYRRTGDAEYIRRHKKKLFEVAYVLVHLQDERDGLAIAMIGYPVKYTMDNSEGYGGLKAFCELAAEMGWDDVEDYRDARDAMKSGILKSLYDPVRRNFRWAVGKNGKVHSSSWDKVYPDSLAQIFPLLYGIVEPESELGRHLWREFSKRYSKRDMQGIEQEILYRMVKDMME